MTKKYQYSSDIVIYFDFMHSLISSTQDFRER